MCKGIISYYVDLEHVLACICADHMHELQRGRGGGSLAQLELKAS